MPPCRHVLQPGHTSFGSTMSPGMAEELANAPHTWACRPRTFPRKFVGLIHDGLRGLRSRDREIRRISCGIVRDTTGIRIYQPGVIDSVLTALVVGKTSFSMRLEQIVDSKTALDTDSKLRIFAWTTPRYCFSNTTAHPGIDKFGTPGPTHVPQDQGTGLILRLSSIRGSRTSTVGVVCGF